VFYVADGTRRETFDQLFDLREHARGGRPLDLLARGELRGRQRPVAGDRVQRGGLRGAHVSTRVLAHAPRKPGDHRAQAMCEIGRGDGLHR